MASLGTLCEFARIKKRVKKMEKRMANEVLRLQNIQKAILDHNDADAKFQTAVKDKLDELRRHVAIDNSDGINRAILDIEAAVAAQPVLTIPPDPVADPVDTNPAPVVAGPSPNPNSPQPTDPLPTPPPVDTVPVADNPLPVDTTPAPVDAPAPTDSGSTAVPGLPPEAQALHDSLPNNPLVSA